MSKYNKDIVWSQIIGDPDAEKNNGYVGDLMSVAEKFINRQYEEGHITGSDVGQVMSSMIPSAFQQAIQYGTQERIRELEIDKLEKDIDVTERGIVLQEGESAKKVELTGEQIKSEVKNNETGGILDKRKEELQKRIDLVDKQESELGLNGESKRAIEAQQVISVTKDVEKKTEDLAVLTATRANRIAQSGKNLEKITAEIAYLIEQKTQLTASVGHNNVIKALDAYASTLGTIGAGGLGVSTEMWSVYYGMISSLTNIDAPASGSISVTKIT